MHIFASWFAVETQYDDRYSQFVGLVRVHGGVKQVAAVGGRAAELLVAQRAVRVLALGRARPVACARPPAARALQPR